MIAALLAVQLACFQLCGWVGVLKIIQVGSSAGCSVWREWLLLTGIGCQLVVMIATGAAWQVWISPVASAISIGTLLAVEYRYR